MTVDPTNNFVGFNIDIPTSRIHLNENGGT